MKMAIAVPAPAPPRLCGRNHRWVYLGIVPGFSPNIFCQIIGDWCSVCGTIRTKRGPSGANYTYHRPQAHR